MEVGDQRHAAAGVSPGDRRLGGTQGHSGQLRKITPLIGIRSLDHPARSAMQGSCSLT